MTTHTLSPADFTAEPPTPGEARLARASRILGLGSAASGVAALLIALFALAAGLLRQPALFEAGHLLAFRYAGAADIALAVAILVALLNISGLLVMMVGISAREPWALPGLGLLVAADLLALIGLGALPALIGLGAAGAALVICLGAWPMFRTNPVMMKELRGRMRGARAFLILSIYLGLMSAFALLIYLILRTASGGATSAAGTIGRALFTGVVGVELLLILFIAPSFTAGAITGERERQTYDLLQTTLLSSPSFVVGKLESALGYIVLLLLAGVPLQSLAFLFGGVSEGELVLAFVLLLVLAIALGTIGIYYSSALSRTLAASVRAYTLIGGLLFIAPLLLNVVVRPLTLALTGAAPAFEAALVYINLLLTAINPLTAALSTQQLLIERDTLSFYTYTLASDGSQIPLVSPWILFTLFYLILSALLLVAAVRRTRQVGDDQP